MPDSHFRQVRDVECEVEMLRNQALRIKIVQTALEWIKKYGGMLSSRLEILSWEEITLDAESIDRIVSDILVIMAPFEASSMELLGRWDMGASEGRIINISLDDIDIYLVCELDMPKVRKRLRALSQQWDESREEELIPLLQKFIGEVNRLRTEIETKQEAIAVSEGKLGIPAGDTTIKIVDRILEEAGLIRNRINITTDEAPAWIQIVRDRCAKGFESVFPEMTEERDGQYYANAQADPSAQAETGAGTRAAMVRPEEGGATAEAI